MTTKHREIMFEVSHSSSCCGLLEVSGFELAADPPAWMRDALPPISHDTVIEQMTAFETELFKQILQSICDDNNNAGGGYLLTATLLSLNRFARKHQFPALEEYFLKSGWSITNTFKNRNTGNTINNFTRFVTDDELIAAGAVHEDDDEDDDDDYSDF